MDRIRYLAVMAERGRKCAADVLATGHHLDLAKRMLALAMDCDREGAVRRRVAVGARAAGRAGAAKREDR